MAGAQGAICLTWEGTTETEAREARELRGGGRRGTVGTKPGPLRVRVETLLGASGVDVVKLLLLLRLDVLIFLHSAGVLHIGPVCRQNHQVVDLKGGGGAVFLFSYSFDHHCDTTATF